MPGVGKENGSVTWTNRAGESATQSASIAWAEKNGKFTSPPTVDGSQSGITTFSELWVKSEPGPIYTELINDRPVECMNIKITFTGRFKIFFWLSWDLAKIEMTYQVCACGMIKKLT